MPREPQYGTTLNSWEGLLVAMIANEQDFAQFASQRQQLASFGEQARDAAKEQAAHAAGKQEATVRLQTSLREGRKVATFLRNAVLHRYGNRSEKLVEFGLQPLRPRPRPTPETPTTPSTPTEPPTTEPPATTPATPETKT